MALAQSSPVVGVATPAPRASLLVMVGWYGAILVSFAIYVGSLSGRVPAGCDAGCDSDRSRMLLFGLYTAAPALFLALLVSLAALWLLSVRGRPRSAALVGTMSAAPALVVCGVLAIVR